MIGQGAMVTELIRGDRRRNRRYSHVLPLRFHFTNAGGTVITGSGFTVDLSRGGICFETEEAPPSGAIVEAFIAWPFKLQNIAALELVVRGSVLRHTDLGVVLRLASYEFRTCGTNSFFETPENTGIARTA